MQKTLRKIKAEADVVICYDDLLDNLIALHKRLTNDNGKR